MSLHWHYVGVEVVCAGPLPHAACARARWGRAGDVRDDRRRHHAHHQPADRLAHQCRREVWAAAVARLGRASDRGLVSVDVSRAANRRHVRSQPDLELALDWPRRKSDLGPTRSRPWVVFWGSAEDLLEPASPVTAAVYTQALSVEHWPDLVHMLQNSAIFVWSWPNLGLRRPSRDRFAKRRSEFRQFWATER